MVPTGDAARPSPVLGSRPRLGSLARPSAAWLWWLPVFFAGLYVLGALSDLHTILTAIYQNSDYAAAPVLAQLLAHAPSGSYTILGDHAYFEEFLALLLTRGLPLHRQLWFLAPVLFSIGGLAALLWSVARAFGLWAAAIVGSALVCLGDLGLLDFFSWGAHGSAAVHAVVLAAALVWFVPRAHSLSWPKVSVGAAALGLFSALPTAGDRLFLVWGLVPFVAATLLIAWRGRRPASERLAAFGLGTAAVTLIGGAVFAHAMSANGIGAYPPAANALLSFATPAELARNTGTFLEAFTSLGGGDFFGVAATSAAAVATFVSGALVLAALAVVLLDIKRRVSSAAPRSLGGDGAVDARSAYAAFWSLSLLISISAYLLGSPASSVSTAAYLLGAYVAVAALLPLLLLRGRTWKLVVVVAVCAFAVSANYRLHFEPLLPSSSPDATTAAALARFARSEHARYGYADYWDAVTLTWQTDFKTEIIPVADCGEPPSPLCEVHAVELSSWYTPRSHVRSLLILDPLFPEVTRPAALGPPVASTTIGRLRVYVYPYDIASRIGHG